MTVALVAAGGGAFVAGRLRLNPILGYLIAGVIIGPFTPGYVAHGGTVQNLAELGLIFLLFSLGLGFSLGELRSIGVAPLVGNAVVMAVIGALFWAMATLAHLPHPITLAIVVSLSSTAIGAALLGQWKIENQRVGHIVLALLIVQDLIAVALLVITSTPGDSLTPAGVLAPVLRAVAFVVIALVLGATVLHRLVVRLLQKAPAETLFGAFAAVALVAAWLAYLMGLSFEFGAFIAGAVVSEAAGSRMVQSVVAPFRALFVSLFFVAMGMSFDPLLAGTNWVVVGGIGVGLVVVRLVGWGVAMRVLGLSRNAAVLAAVALLPLGEFNIVLANAAVTAHRMTHGEDAILLGVTFLSITIATVGASLLSIFPGLRRDRIPFDALPHTGATALIVGFGRVGRTVAAVLRRADVAFAVVELDGRVVDDAREDGVTIARGDGGDPLVLDDLSQAGTRVVVAATPDSATNGAIAHRLAAGARVVARATNTHDVAALRERGAAAALVPETEGALQFARLTLERLGFVPADIDRHIEAQRALMDEATWPE